ncbi:MAG: PH domain-containing protein [Chryseobacterium sp.]|nr:PH domain-containing protein [Chryseobacterium sp.]
MSDFQNEPITMSQLPDFEEVNLEPVSKKYLKVLIFNALIFSMVLIVSYSVSLFFFYELLGNVLIYIGIIILLLIVLNIIWTLFEFKNRKFALREKDLIYKRGLLRHTTSIVPFNRIQHITVLEGWYSRKLGLKSVAVYTAGGTWAMMKIAGLPKETADKINQLILRKIDEEETANAENLTDPEHD